KVALGWAATVAVVVAIAFFNRVSDLYPRSWVGLWLCLGVAFSLSGRYGVARLIEARRRAGKLRLVVAIVGPESFATEIRQHFASPGEVDIEILGCFEASLERASRSVTALVELARRVRVDEILVYMPDHRDAGFSAMLKKLGELPVNVHLCPDLRDLPIPSHRFTLLGDALTIKVVERPLSGWSSVLKRAEDIALSSLALLFFGPLMALVAALIKLDSEGPVFFRQTRYGFNNNPILVWKFRTMRVDAANDPIVPQAKRDDPRVTRLGRFLRRTSLDELPQLINVLMGSMSLIGPRPHAVAHNEYYAQLIDFYLHRHRVKPGITGWAQVNGWRGETPTVDAMHARVNHDLYYIENWSLLLDLRILFRTVAVGFVHHNAF
ncbi:MAG TPA: undecaprenyl-phosphate glucose phosphotransferase, partial [Stellaceae bacterium]|nr:undecaprenyl-phosphate glucose phosphotransferase [Stellaceae bacterium]